MNQEWQGEEGGLPSFSSPQEMDMNDRILAEIEKGQVRDENRGDQWSSSDIHFNASISDLIEERNGDSLREISIEIQERILAQIQYKKQQQQILLQIQQEQEHRQMQQMLQEQDQHQQGQLQEQQHRQQHQQQHESRLVSEIRAGDNSMEPFMLETLQQRIHDAMQNSVQEENLDVSIAELIDPILQESGLIDADMGLALSGEENDLMPREREKLAGQTTQRTDRSETKHAPNIFVSQAVPAMRASPLAHSEGQPAQTTDRSELKHSSDVFASQSVPSERASMLLHREPPAQREPSIRYPGAYRVRGVDHRGSFTDSFDNLLEGASSELTLKPATRKSMLGPPTVEEDSSQKAEVIRGERRKTRRTALVVGTAIVVVTAIAVGVAVGVTGGNSPSPLVRAPPVTLAPTQSQFPTSSPTVAPTATPWTPVRTPLQGIGDGDEFGASIDLRDDNIVAIGSPGFNNSLGMVQVFDIAGNQTVGQPLFGSTTGERFGTKVMLSRAATASPILAVLNNSTRISMYRIPQGSATWQATAPIDTSVLLLAMNSTDPAAAVVVDCSMSGDGLTVAVALASGRVVVLSFDATVQRWTLVGHVLDVQSDRISLSSNGRTLLVSSTTQLQILLYTLERANSQQGEEWRLLPSSETAFDLPTNYMLSDLETSSGGAVLSESGDIFILADRQVGVMVVFSAANGFEWSIARTIITPVHRFSLSGDTIVVAYIGDDSFVVVEALQLTSPRELIRLGGTIQIEVTIPTSDIWVSVAGNGNSIAVGVDNQVHFYSLV